MGFPCLYIVIQAKNVGGEVHRNANANESNVDVWIGFSQYSRYIKYIPRHTNYITVS